MKQMVTTKMNILNKRTKNKNSLPLFWLLVFLFTSPATFADSVAIDRVVAIVNDGVVFDSQVEERLKSVYQQFKSRNEVPPDDVLRQQVLERLIVENLQLQLAERAGVTISNEELQNTLASIAHQNNTDVAGLREKIEAGGITFKYFTKSIEQEMIIQRLQQAAVSKRIDISDQDVLNFLNSEEGKQKSAATYHLAHILLPLGDGASDIDKARLEATAKQIVAEGRDPTTRNKFSDLAITYSKAQDADKGGDLGWRKKTELPSLYADKVDAMNVDDVSDPFFASGGYHILKLLGKRGAGPQWINQTRARHILIKPSIIRSEEETTQLLESLRQQLLNGADFSELAKKYSEDYGSALKGGDLGWTSPGQLGAELQTAMDATEINAISKPFKTQYGWHIVQVEERRTQNMSDDMLKQAARNFLMQRRFEEELPRWLKEIRDEAYVDIKTQDDTATKNPASPETTDTQSKDVTPSTTP